MTQTLHTYTTRSPWEHTDQRDPLTKSWDIDTWAISFIKVKLFSVWWSAQSKTKLQKKTKNGQPIYYYSKYRVD